MWLPGWAQRGLMTGSWREKHVSEFEPGNAGYRRPRILQLPAVEAGGRIRRGSAVADAGRPCPSGRSRATGRVLRVIPDRPEVRTRRNGQRYNGRPVDEPSGIPVRVVEYEVTNGDGSNEIFCLITTILDPGEASAEELAAAYAERWEFESSLDELKTHQRGRGGVLRSNTPEMVRQEIWALLLTHYAIRHLMREAADQADVDPDRLSFMRSLRVIRRQVTGQAGFSPLTANGCS